MDESLKQALASTISGLQTTLGAAKDFTIEQAPLVVQEFLRWTVVKNIGVAVLLVLACIALWVVLRKTLVWMRSNGESAVGLDESDRMILGCFLVSGLGFLFAFSLVGVFYYLCIGLEVLIAPRWFLIEQAAKLFK